MGRNRDQIQRDARSVDVMRARVLFPVLGGLTAFMFAACGAGRTSPPLHQSAPAPSASAAESTRIAEAMRLVDDGLNDQARRAVDALLAAGITHPHVRWCDARLLFAQADYGAAAARCEQLVAEAPAWIEPRVLLARSFQEAGRDAAAASVYADLDRLVPDNPWGPYGQAVFAMRQQRVADAKTLVSVALIRDANFIPALRLSAAIAGQERDLAREESFLLRVSELDPEHSEVWWRLGEIAAGAQRFVEAAARRERAWVLEPRRDLARRLAGEAAARGDDEEAALWRERSDGP